VSPALRNVDSFACWKHARDAVEDRDIFAGVFKSDSFGAAIALMSCQPSCPAARGVNGTARELELERSRF
jgi:ABC-type transporter Mla maintaining outer membrane lipid asymmetry permease subunit MlaE